MSLYLLRPPRTRGFFTPSGIGSRFDHYEVQSRPARTPTQPWRTRYLFGVPDGYDREAVEAQHTYFIDAGMGWASDGGHYEAGHDWRAFVVDIFGAKSKLDIDYNANGIIVPGDDHPWLTYQSAPYLDCPLEVYEDSSSGLDREMQIARYAGRPKFVTQSPDDRPGRQFSATAEFFDPVGPDGQRVPIAAANSGRQATLLRPLGDRIVGTFDTPGFADARDDGQTMPFTMTETLPEACEINVPAGLVMDGVNDYITAIPDALHTFQDDQAFTVIVAGGFSDTGGAYALSKGNVGSEDSYAIRRSAAGTLQFYVDGDTAAGGVSDADAGWFDSDHHVAIGTADPAGLKLYRDGELRGATSLNFGSVSNSKAYTIGANNQGGSGFMSFGVDPGPFTFFGFAPGTFYAAAYFSRALSAAEARAASYYLLGYPGYRMPTGVCRLFIDLRDDGCWTGVESTFVNLADVTATVTAHGSPLTRGIPWALSELENDD